MVVPNNESLISYLQNMISQVKCNTFYLVIMIGWLESNDLHSLVLVIYGMNSRQVLERWTFAVETDKDVVNSNGAAYRFHFCLIIEPKRKIFPLSNVKSKQSSVKLPLPSRFCLYWTNHVHLIVL